VLNAVFFDFGGTLMDGESDRRAHRQIVEEVKRRYALPEEVGDLVDQLDQNLFSYSPQRAEKWVRAERIITDFFLATVGDGLDVKWLWEVYFDAHQTHCTLFDDAMATLESVKATGLHTGIISDIDDDYFTFQTKQFSLDNFFDSVTTSDEVGVGKPNPRIFETALAKARCLPSAALYIGDSLEKDIVGAKGMGMYAIWYRGSCSDIPDRIVQNLSDIPPIVAEILRS
jgi:HAD superfamily hydrolase (TIGR01549 family)